MLSITKKVQRKEKHQRADDKKEGEGDEEKMDTAAVEETEKEQADATEGAETSADKGADVSAVVAESSAAMEVVRMIGIAVVLLFHVPLYSIAGEDGREQTDRREEAGGRADLFRLGQPS